MKSTINDKIQQYFGEFRLQSYSKGTVLTLAGQEPVGISLLVEGAVEQYDITPAGIKTVLNIYRPGAFFPMSWAINSTPNQYFFEASTDVKIRLSPADEAINFLKDNPDVMFDLLSRVYKGTDVMLKRAVLTASGQASARLAYELLIEAYRFGEKTSEKTYEIKIKHSTLASRVGLARETVSREMKILEREGIVEKRANGIKVDIKALESKIDLATQL